MEVTRKRHTPENMLRILREIEDLCDKGQLVPKYCRPEIPAIYNILMVLIEKGVVSKKIGKYTWIGGNPNIYMAKEVIKENQKYQFQLLEKRVEREKNTQNYLKSLNSKNVMESSKLEEIQYETNIEFLIEKEPEVVDKQEEYLEVIQDLKKQLNEYEIELSELLKENENLIYKIDKNQQVREQKKSNPRKVKFLGITIFKIE